MKSVNSDIRDKKGTYSFYKKFIGALFLSGKSYYMNLTKVNAWHGILVFIFGSSLLSLILSTTTWEPIMELFYHYAINLDLKYIVINIYFSPVLFIITEIVLILLWLLIIFLISVYKKIKIINLLNSGFVISPSFISIFYFLNKYILKISISTFGEILISTIIIWIILTGLAFLFSTLEIEIGGFISLSVKSILSRKKRTLGAIFGIAISVALIVVPKPLVTGYYYQIGILAGKYQYANFLIITNSSSYSFSDSIINIKIPDQITHQYIDIKCPQKYFKINISKENNNISTYFYGLNYSLFRNLRQTMNWYYKNPTNMNDSEIILGLEVAIMLNVSSNNLPIKANLSAGGNKREVNIIGIFQTNSYYDGGIIGDFNLSNYLNPLLSNYYSVIEIKLTDYTKSTEVISYIENNFNGLNAQRENQMNSFISNLINRTTYSLILLFIFIFCLMLFGMFHIMQVIIKDSKKEIQIYKSIGANNNQIIRIFLYESFILSFLGSLLGAFGGIFLCYGVIYLIYILLSIYISPIFDPLFILFAIVVSTSSGLIGGFIPSYNISRKKIERMLE
ncbi:MAG: ABC transporter permease [Candidatus Helarchaeota archaeon]